MKKGIIALQILFMYIVVSLNLTSPVVNAQGSIFCPEVTEAISVGENEKDISLLSSVEEEEISSDNSEENTEEVNTDTDNMEEESAVTYAASLKIPSSKTMLKGKSETLKISKVQPSDATLGITWSSTKPSIAKVNAKTGKITAQKYGTTYIKAKLQNGKVYQCKVSVEDPKLSTTSVVLLKGNKKQISVSQNYNKVYYSSANKAVAVVTSKGVITAKGKGTAKITAKVGTKRIICTVKVEEPKISASKIELTAGKSKTLKVTGTSQKVTWSSSDTSIATVNSSGKVTTKSAGKAKIYASVGGKTIATCYVIVKAKKTTSSSTDSTTVYITRTGEKYHRYGCRYLRQSCIPVSLKSALECGYDACSVCY